MHFSPRSLLLFAILGTFTLAACGGGGGGTTTPITAPDSIGFTVGDAPADTLSTAMVTISSLKLVAQGGGATANLLPAPRSFEFLGLSTKQALLALTSQVPAGTYDRVELVVNAVSAKDLAGVPVAVQLNTPTGTAYFTDFGGAPLVFAGNGYVPCSVDINLSRSFVADPSNPGGLLFNLVFNAMVQNATSFDEFRAEIVSTTPLTGRFLAHIIDDRAPTQDFGLLEIQVADGDYMVQEDGRVMGTAMGFLNDMRMGHTVQVSGSMQTSGVFRATRVIMEDGGGLGGSDRIEIEGEIQSIDTGAGIFELFIKETEKGASSVDTALVALGNPATITVSFDNSTRLIGDHAANSGTGLVGTTLVPGMEVDVRFATFIAPGPFAATSIEVGDGRSQGGDNSGVCYEGTISSVAGLPTSFEFALDSSEPAVQEGQVAAPVEVSLAAGPTLVLDSGPNPTLLASDLVDGIRCEVRGDLNGAPLYASIMSSHIKVKPGEMTGLLTSVDLGASTITVTVNQIDRSFGGSTVPSGSVTLQVDTTAHLRGEGDAMALVDLAALLQSLGAGEELSVEIEGIADGSGNFIAWDVRAEIQVIS